MTSAIIQPGRNATTAGVQPHPDGTLAGESNQLIAVGCANKRPVTFTGSGDVDVNTLPDPATLPPRVVSPAEALRGHYRETDVTPNGYRDQADYVVSTDCLRTGDRCMSFFHRPPASAMALHEPGDRYTHSVEQALTTFQSADQALAFVQRSAGKWNACAGQNISESLNGGSTQWTFGNLVGDPPKITMIMNRHNARGWTCQRVLSAVRNAVIDVKACAFKISDQGVQAADKIAAKATQ